MMDKKVLLIADDEEMNRIVIRKFLKSRYDVIEAKDGEEAMTILNRQHIDVLLLDIIMPRKDGLEVLEEVRNNPELDHIGILVATSVKEKTERRALSLGADDVIAKPYDPIVIKKRLENIEAYKMVAHQETMDESDLDTAAGKNEIYAELSEVGRKLEKFSCIIRENLMNHKLMGEVAEELLKESKQIKEKLVKS